MYLTASQIVITMIGRADWVCSHRLPNTMWYRCGGRESNLLPNLMSVWWWTGETVKGLMMRLAMKRVAGSALIER